MLFLFGCIDPTGRYYELSLSGLEIEVGLEAITVLVQDGWQMKRVNLLADDHRSITLPVEAFDGESLLKPIRELEQAWKLILV